MTMDRVQRDQAGLVGKIAVVWLLIIALFVVAAFDGIAIVFTKYRVADLAGNAASEAASTFKDSGKAQVACAAAVAYVTDHDAEAKVPLGGCVIYTDGTATITVRRDAKTLLAERLSITEDLTHLESTGNASAPI
ncbi:MAG: hypothetical protein ABI635_07760 [Actinomycetota bacterium]